MRERKFLRNGTFHSIIREEEDKGFPVFSWGGEIFADGESRYFNRCLSKFEEGKTSFRKKLIDARKIIFSREEMVNWLYKIKEEAEEEYNLVFVEARASFKDDDEIDYERVGLMGGIYHEANRFLNMMASIELREKDRPHYIIHDRLNELDQIVLRKDEIPGYYRVFNDDRVKKHPYEIKNLDDYWQKTLSHKENYNVGSDFGDPRYLLNDYHIEFTRALTKIAPIAEVAGFLDYHLKYFQVGSPVDFLNHLQYRIIPMLANWAGADYLMYRQVIEEWLKEKYFGLSNEDERFLVDALIDVLTGFLEDIFENLKRNDENKYNVVIKQGLTHRLRSKNWHVADQSLGGLTDSSSLSSRAGIAFRDLIISNSEGRPISAFECLRLRNTPTQSKPNTVIDQHVKKIFRNEPIGISPLFIIIYCETKTFADTWNNYLDRVSEVDFEQYHLINLEREFNEQGEYANIKLAKALHNRELNTVTVYHVMINMHP